MIMFDIHIITYQQINTDSIMIDNIDKSDIKYDSELDLC